MPLEYYFYLRIVFFDYRVKQVHKKTEMFSDRVFGYSIYRKNFKNPAFLTCTIETSESPVRTRRAAATVNSPSSLPKSILLGLVQTNLFIYYLIVSYIGAYM